MKYSRELITPDMAKEYLTHNIPNNRHISRDRVMMYAADMLNDNWVMSPTSVIAFDTNGMLIDGQHRLMAIIEANKPVHMIKCVDADPSSVRVIDTGMKRTVRQIGKMTGSSDMTNDTMVAVCRFYCKEIRRPIIKTMSYQEIEGMIDRHRNELSVVVNEIGCGLHCFNNRKIPIAVTVAVLMAYLNGVSKVTLMQFVRAYRLTETTEERCKYPIKLAQICSIGRITQHSTVNDLETLAENYIYAFDNNLSKLSTNVGRKYTKVVWE